MKTGLSMRAIVVLAAFLSPLVLGLSGCSAVPTSTPPPTSRPEPTPIPLQTIPADCVQGIPDMDLTIVFNNVEYGADLGSSWGFGCYIEYGGRRILFDTGGDGPMLIANMDKLGIDPVSIDVVVLSHVHADHTDGLRSVLDAGGQPVVYMLQSFGESLKAQARAGGELRLVDGGGQICKGVYTTGGVPGNPREQALAIETSRGLVVITGCAHPGVNTLVRRAIEVTGGDVHLVLGGFHLGSAGEGKVSTILDDLQAMGVQKVAPSHCTGERATAMFAERYGDDFIASGVGFRMSIQGSPGTD
jgi:7,8-dihydropterin-6-yl-methyl-4-(beta-D-ribofuranosyl)aminobenzene 5'-phosphate synthase